MNTSKQDFALLVVLTIMTITGVYLEVYDVPTAFLVFGLVAILGYFTARWIKKHVGRGGV